uniref:Uncharacterized protein n=1 Tax=Ditylum brightwellii TaxID=49249 RepID=A0A6S8Z3R3_9STRA
MLPRPGTPPPVDGRTHMDIQTDTYLEELIASPDESDMNTQTDGEWDCKPLLPLYMPAKMVADKSTQIEPGELFDFDTEVAPILDVLVEKSIETAVMELEQEEEIASLRRRQDLFEMKRNAELAEVQRLEQEANKQINDDCQSGESKELNNESKGDEVQQSEETFTDKIAKDILEEAKEDALTNLEASGYSSDQA